MGNLKGLWPPTEDFLGGGGGQRKEGDESRILEEGLKKGKGGTGRNSEEVGGKEMGRKEREEGGKRLESI